MSRSGSSFSLLVSFVSLLATLAGSCNSGDKGPRPSEPFGTGGAGSGGTAGPIWPTASGGVSGRADAGPTGTAPSTGPSGTFGKEALVGQWKEYWGVGQVTDVDYNDIYIVSLGIDGGLVFACRNRPNYVFENSLFDGTNLSVTLDNNGFVIKYVLAISENGGILTGTATTVKDTYNIIWEKVSN
jgi:hypothetical protein